jgi:hypothetical protein
MSKQTGHKRKSPGEGDEAGESDQAQLSSSGSKLTPEQLRSVVRAQKRRAEVAQAKAARQQKKLDLLLATTAGEEDEPPDPPLTAAAAASSSLAAKKPRISQAGRTKRQKVAADTAPASSSPPAARSGMVNLDTSGQPEEELAADSHAAGTGSRVQRLVLPDATIQQWRNEVDVEAVEIRTESSRPDSCSRDLTSLSQVVGGKRKKDEKSNFTEGSKCGTNELVQLLVDFDSCRDTLPDSLQVKWALAETTEYLDAVVIELMDHFPHVIPRALRRLHITPAGQEEVDISAANKAFWLWYKNEIAPRLDALKRSGKFHDFHYTQKKEQELPKDLHDTPTQEQPKKRKHLVLSNFILFEIWNSGHADFVKLWKQQLGVRRTQLEGVDLIVPARAMQKENPIEFYGIVFPSSCVYDYIVMLIKKMVAIGVLNDPWCAVLFGQFVDPEIQASPDAYLFVGLDDNARYEMFRSHAAILVPAFARILALGPESTVQALLALELPEAYENDGVGDDASSGTTAAAASSESHSPSSIPTTPASPAAAAAAPSARKKTTAKGKSMKTSPPEQHAAAASAASAQQAAATSHPSSHRNRKSKNNKAVPHFATVAAPSYPPAPDGSTIPGPHIYKSPESASRMLPLMAELTSSHGSSCPSNTPVLPGRSGPQGQDDMNTSNDDVSHHATPSDVGDPMETTIDG